MFRTTPGDALRLWPMVADLQASLREVVVIAGSGAHPAQEMSGSGRHTVPTLLICLEGVARIDLGRGHRDVPAGTALVIAPWIVHAHPATRAGCSVLHLGICPRSCDLTLQPAETETGRGLDLCLPRKPAADILPRLLATSDPQARLEIARGLCATLGRLHPAPLDQSEPLRRMKAFLLSRLGHPHTAGAVLAASGLGRRRAHAVFTAYFGLTPKAYLDQIRLDWARRLLAGGASVAEAARRAGYGERTMLSRRFRQLAGVAPGRWRRSARADQRVAATSLAPISPASA